MAFEIGKITYKQWSEINRALSNVSLELETLPQTRTSEEVRKAQNVLSEIHRGTIANPCGRCILDYRENGYQSISESWEERDSGHT
jgi:hypothetical protein